ncbi:hypothetical protein [Alkalihalobacillus sp. AL-G]|nr:hypothetical protein [Alkalihalobacillus sp. AL-G]WLD94084.1 hypothetical protein MOJ78_04075 [Alkalihalobacillus sp. AL-G]
MSFIVRMDLVNNGNDKSEEGIPPSSKKKRERDAVVYSNFHGDLHTA